MQYPKGSESVEVLVKRSEFEMEDGEPPRPLTCGMLDCLSAKESFRERKNSFAHKRASRRIGVERQMRVTYNQPHLVEPMKLTVYDELPSTPVPTQQPSQVSRFVSHSRKSLSRASTRASFASRRRMKPSISKPQAVVAADGCQLRRYPSFRPLQLSIYMPEKRLSNLPEFDTISFTDEGEIKFPPRALVRTQSEDMLRPRSLMLSDIGATKSASMFEQSLSRRISHVRQNTDSTVISNSRPPSEYDALHSHPVSWYSAPGLPPTMQFATAPTLLRTILSPMQEEFTPPPSGAVIINGKVLAFPEVDAYRTATEMAHNSLLPPACGQEGHPSAPSPTVDPGPNRRTTVVTKHQAKISESASIMLASSGNSVLTRATALEQPAQPYEEPKSYSHTDFKTNNRINQWLENDKEIASGRSRESSISTIKTATTTSSFAEHRRKRSQFYQLNQDNSKPSKLATSPVDDKKPTDSAAKIHKTPTPLTLYRPFPPQKAIKGAVAVSTARTAPHKSKSSVSLKSYTHNRTQTASTVASTIATDVLFEPPETPELEGCNTLSSLHALPQQNRGRAYDAESMTTVDMKSRTGTMKSMMTTHSPHRQASPVPVQCVVKDTGVAKDCVLDFRGKTPSPTVDSPQTPLSAKTEDVEKLMFEMCAQSGYRRVNVGVAF